MKYFLLLIIVFVFNKAFAELLKPSASLKPEQVISIQLNALKNNNNPYQNAGIVQTWEFAHPSNRMLTGPLQNFIKMMYSPSYTVMIDHLDHKIIYIEGNNYISFYFIELIDKKGNKFSFKWILEKVLVKGYFANCWMTTSVSQPMFLSKST